MAQQTALQLLLIKSVELEIGKYFPSDVLNELQKAYFEAKEMEKQQKIKFANDYIENYIEKLNSKYYSPHLTPEEYYNETYGK
jgi:hypothetical protein